MSILAHVRYPRLLATLALVALLAFASSSNAWIVRHWALLAVDGESLYEINLQTGGMTKLGPCNAGRLIYDNANDTLYGTVNSEPVVVDRNTGMTFEISPSYRTAAQMYSFKTNQFYAAVWNGSTGHTSLSSVSLFSPQVYHSVDIGRTAGPLTALQPDYLGNF